MKFETMDSKTRPSAESAPNAEAPEQETVVKKKWPPIPDDFYERLGVAPNADAKTIKRALVRGLQVVHPDLNPNDPKAADWAQALNEAEQLLNNVDAMKRTNYNLDRAKKRGVYQGPQPGAKNPWEPEIIIEQAPKTEPVQPPGQQPPPPRQPGNPNWAPGAAAVAGAGLAAAGLAAARNQPPGQPRQYADPSIWERIGEKIYHAVRWGAKNGDGIWRRVNIGENPKSAAKLTKEYDALVASRQAELFDVIENPKQIAAMAKKYQETLAANKGQPPHPSKVRKDPNGPLRMRGVIGVEANNEWLKDMHTFYKKYGNTGEDEHLEIVGIYDRAGRPTGQARVYAIKGKR